MPTCPAVNTHARGRSGSIRTAGAMVDTPSNSNDRTHVLSISSNPCTSRIVVYSFSSVNATIGELSSNAAHSLPTSCASERTGQ